VDLTITFPPDGDKWVNNSWLNKSKMRKGNPNIIPVNMHVTDYS
jgi:hypothetical protein